MNDFVHLHLHTEYSFLDGFSKVWDTPSKEQGVLVKRLSELGHKACAVTDHGSISSWLRWEKATKGTDIKPIFGIEGYYCNDINIKGADEKTKLDLHRGVTNPKEKKRLTKAYEYVHGLSRRSHFVANAMNEKGIYEIQKSLSIANVDGFYYRPRWDWNMIQNMKNCMFSTACMGGILGWRIVRVLDKQDDKENFQKYLKEAYKEAELWKNELGDRFYIELMPIEMATQPKVNLIYFKIAKDLDIPVILTNDSHYVYKEDWEAHDILLALQSFRYEDLATKDVLNDPNRMRYEARDLYVKSRKEMIDDFLRYNPKFNKKLANEFCDNTLEYAERCNAKPNKKKMIMPQLTIPKGYDQVSYLKHLVQLGWKQKIIPYVKKENWPEYKDRLKEELKLIIKQGFTPYFILCNALMKWVDDNGIARGPARGSSAGSLVAYLLSMTMIDPIPHKLLFSRFIDPNRTDFPDVDMDFEDRRRHEIVQYFIDTYGMNNVAILGNNMVFKARMALQDVARMFKINHIETRKISELVVQRSGADSRLSFCLEDTFKQHKFAQEYREKYPKVCKIAGQLEGLTKQQGVHAAGVVIADGDICNYTAVRRFPKKGYDFHVTTIDKHDAEDIGLLKMDILGLNTMTIISEANKLIEKRHGKKIDIEGIVRDVTYNGGDPKVYKTFADAHTIGVFQFGSPGLTRLAKQVQINKFSEISDATALHRPGPIHSGAMNNYPAYKFGKAKEIKFEHDIIKKWTDDTYGLIIYQEQVMQIVRELGDFDWAQTNTVRKVMSKSGGAEYFMKTFWPTWKESCMKKGLTEKLALKAFRRIMSFGCVTGDTLVLNPYPNQNAKKWITVKELYEWDGYASPLAVGSKRKAYVKMQSYSYTKGRLIPNRIAKVFYNGKKEVYEIVVEHHLNTIKASTEHRFIGRRNGKIGYIKVKDFAINDEIAMDGGYDKESYNMDFVEDIPDNKYGELEMRVFRNNMKNEPCDVCKRKFHYSKMEIHHITYDNPNSRMMYVCNECHKVLEFRKGGRTKKDTKGHKIIWAKISMIRKVGIEDVYDIEMEDRKRPTYVANGFISHNSWAFNLSHSVSYAFVSYICMWFKVHYSLEYVTAYLNYVTDTDGSKTKEMIKEVHRLGIKLKEPDVNISGTKFVIDGDTIVSGLTDIKHVGEKAVIAISQAQPFDGLLDFIERVNSRACNKRTVENLIKGGAFDSFNYNKKNLLMHLEEIHKKMKKKNIKGKQEAEELLSNCMGKEGLTEQEIAQMKTDVSPIVVGKHMSEFYDDVINQFGDHIRITKLKDIELDEGEQQKSKNEMKRRTIWVVGVLTKVDLKRLSQEVKEIIDQKAEQRYALTNIEDGDDFIVASFRGKVYERYEQRLFGWKGKVLLLKGNINIGFKKLYVEEVFELDKVREYLKANRKPYRFNFNYLFQHPITRYFRAKGGIEGIRGKYKCKPLESVLKVDGNRQIWTIVIVRNIIPFTIRKEGPNQGKKFFRIIVEDDTYTGGFIAYPGDQDFKKRMKDLVEVCKNREAVMLRVQRDLKFDPDKNNVMNFAVHKFEAWKNLFIRKFPMKNKS